MGVTSSFQIGRSALTAAQLGVQVTGNNLANAATPGYSRQVADLRAARGGGGGIESRIGSGVRVADVRRALDEAVQARLQATISDQSAAQTTLDVFSQLESMLGELTDHDLGSELNAFFNTWSEAANQSGSQAIVVQQGEQLAQAIHRLRSDLLAQRGQIDQQLNGIVARADGLLEEIAGLNRAIAEAEASGGTANALRDQRDGLVSELSEIMEVTAVEQPSGMANILVGSVPLVLGDQSRGLEVDRRTIDGEVVTRIREKATGEPLAVDSGRAGAMIDSRTAASGDTLAKLDEIASQLIFQVNRLHSTGRPEQAGLTTTTGTLRIPTADRTLALNDPQNQTFAGLPFEAHNGGFDVVTTNTATGVTSSVRIDVDLDGLDSSLQSGVADDTSAEDIRAAIDAIDGLTASFTGDGRLDVEAAPGVEFSFREDSSGALAVLGVNAFFQGTGSTDITVEDELLADPQRLATARYEGDTLTANGNSLAMAQTLEQSLDELGGMSLSESWNGHVQVVAGRTASAKTEAEATTLVRENLEAQRAAVSGVSTDEETLNMLNFQRSYDGAARFLTVVDEMTQVLLSLV